MDIEFEKKLLDNGFKKFRIKQIYHWVFEKRVFDFNKMDNLPISLRQFLVANFTINPYKMENRVVSEDSSIKYSFLTSDNHVVEVVLIKTEKRNTLCISTQIGCPVGCKFCLTGQMGLTRNLSGYEIAFQLMFVESIECLKITNVVYMGMGEPLLNYENTIKSLELFTKKLGLGRRRIVLSTVGIIDKIYELAELPFAPKLAISLHSADVDVRKEIIPISDDETLDELMEALYFYFQMTQLPITFEYVLLEGVNNRASDLDKLIEYSTKIRRSKINLISFNEYKGTAFKSATNILKFQNELKQYIPTFLRTSAGQDILAACGTLYSEHEGKFND